MILNIANGIKNRDVKRIWLDANGVAGFVLYSLVLILVGYYFIQGKMLIPTKWLVIVIGFLLILILFNDKLSQSITNQKQATKVAMVEKIFELIEMILSFASNTISIMLDYVWRFIY